VIKSNIDHFSQKTLYHGHKSHWSGYYVPLNSAIYQISTKPSNMNMFFIIMQRVPIESLMFFWRHWK
jgi:hypothetical protein